MKTSAGHSVLKGMVLLFLIVGWTIKANPVNGISLFWGGLLITIIIHVIWFIMDLFDDGGGCGCC
jgi:hypothetical protein